MEVSIESTELDTDTTCPICNAEFLDDDDLNIHMSQHIQLNVSYKNFCVHCQKIFPDIELYAQHIIEDHLISAVSCGYCSRVFYDTKLLKKHEIKHNATSLTTRISCSQCMSYFYNNTDLESHEFQEHRESKEGVMLQECFSMLSSLLNMNIRKFLNVIVDNITYRCVYCNLSTPDVTIYINHLHDEKVKSYACDNCYDVFPNKIKLRKHYIHQKRCNKYIRQNSPEKQCKKCQQKFLITSYKRHIKLCSGMKCIPCNLNFESVDDYSSHLKFHKKAIPLSTCKYCFRQFVGDFSLEKHIDRAHKDSFHLYKYKCVDCDQLFMHPKLLFTHYFTKHKSMEPYTCKICDKKFKVRKKFTLHIKLQHKSIGFVEFDENYLVFFTDKKSEKPFIPQCQVPTEEMAEKEIIKDKTAGKIKLKINKHLKSKADNEDNNTTLDVDEAELQTFKSNSENNVNKITTKINNKEKTKNLEQESVGEETDVDEAKTFAVNKLATADENNISHSGFDFMNATETEGEHTEAEPNLLMERKRKLKVTKTRKRVKKVDTDLSSDDSDLPLESFKNKVKFKHTPNFSRVRRFKEKFICQKCNKNCYTYQNYHHHLSLHARDKTKQCIKCDETFTSKSALTEHIKQIHSSSKLTETLKQLLERRKNNLPMPIDRKSIVDGLRRTIKRVIFEKSNSSVTMTPVDNKISVKNFFKNFTPDTSDAATKNLDNGITIKAIDGSDVPKPSIKMTKFTPDVVQFNPRPKMPVKFKDDPNSQKYIVSFKLSTISSSRSKLRFSNKIDSNCNNSYNDDQNNVCDETYSQFDGESDIAEDKEDSIPDVAEEVLLDTEPEKPDTLAIQSIPEEYANLKIGHLQEQAPYYKIVNITEVIKPKLKQEKTEAPKKIVLPDGTKLVNVNPLAHLMGDTNMQDIFKPQKRYYEPKPRDITTAIAKALHQRKPTRKKKVTDLCN